MLRKVFDRLFTPGTPGVTGSPGGQYCYAAPASGSWQMQTHYIKLYPVNGRVETPPGTVGTTVVYLPTGQIDYVLATVVTSVWVPGEGAGAPACVTYPPVEAVPAVPARTQLTPLLGWDGGANSVVSQTDNCVATWTMDLVVGVYMGLTTALDTLAPSRYTHAFYFHQTAGRAVFRVRESAVDKTGDAFYTPGDEFRIRRMGGKVEYFHNGAVVYASETPSAGEVYLGTSLYASGDAVPSSYVEIVDTPPPAAWTDILGAMAWEVYGPSRDPTTNPFAYSGAAANPIGLFGAYTVPAGYGVSAVRAVATVTTTEGAPGDQAEIYISGSDVVATLVSGVTTLDSGVDGVVLAAPVTGTFSLYLDMDLTSTAFSNITFEFVSLEVQLVAADAPPPK